MHDIEPHRPANLDAIAAEALRAMGETPNGGHIVIGGGVALNCYLSTPRPTFDIDGWWAQQSTTQQREETIGSLTDVAQTIANAHAGAELVATERTSTVVSIDVRQGKRKLLSFQIAARDIELERPNATTSPFAPIPIEALADNIGAKMSALVNRGAPRDFLDIARIAADRLAAAGDLWALYRAKNPTADVRLAQAQINQHLAAIELRRPLNTLSAADRERAEAIRSWFKNDLLAVGRDIDQSKKPLPRTGITDIDRSR